MNAKQLWEAARRTCDTIGDMAVDKQIAAQLRRLQAVLRGPVQKQHAKQAYDLASMARDALAHGDKEDARRLLGQSLALLMPEPEAPKETPQETKPAPEPETPGTVAEKRPTSAETEALEAAPEKTRAAAEPETPKAAPVKEQAEPASEKPAEHAVKEAASPKTAARKPSALRNWALKTFGGEKGRIQAEINQLEARIAGWETQRAAFTKRRDELKAALQQKVEQARKLDPNSNEYQELRHAAMMIKPEADVYSAQVARLMANVEKYSGLIAACRASLLNRETGLNADEVGRMSVRLEDIETANEEAAALQEELDSVTGRAQGIIDTAARTPADQGSFFDDLVAGLEPAAPAAPAKAQPTAAPVSAARPVREASAPAAPAEPETAGTAPAEPASADDEPAADAEPPAADPAEADSRAAEMTDAQ